MIKCLRCGYENQDNSQFCLSCGNRLQIVEQENPQGDFIQNNNNHHNQYNNSNNPFGNGQNPYNNGYYPPVNQKKIWIAVLLNAIGGFLFYFLSGIGQLYLGLYKRGTALCLLGFVPIIFNFIFEGNHILYLIIFLFGLLYVIYCVFDAYICTKAINENKNIPLLFGLIDLQ